MKQKAASKGTPTVVFGHQLTGRCPSGRQLDEPGITFGLDHFLCGSATSLGNQARGLSQIEAVARICLGPAGETGGIR